jgi:hypothetical protein
MMVPLGTALVLGLFSLFTGLIFRICPNWIPAICCFRLRKSQTTAVTAESGARQNHAYSPVLILPPPRSSFNLGSHRPHHTVSDQEDTSPSFFNPQSVNRFQRRRVVEDAKAAWTRIGIFGFVHTLPLACQVNSDASHDACNCQLTPIPNSRWVPLPMNSPSENPGKMAANGRICRFSY